MKLSRLSRTTIAAIFAFVAFFLTGATPAQTAEAKTAELPAYVALGDSYASGTGAGSYYRSSGDCRRSPSAYPVLWAQANAPSSFSFTACLGARTADVISTQLGPLNARTGLVSITVGGNDAGFVDVMSTCLLREEHVCLTRVRQARAYIANTLPGRLDAVYGAVRDKAPNAQVVVLGYPRMYALKGRCWAGMSEKSRAAINAAADDLDLVISKRAADHGFGYGDVRPPFTGHELCSGDPWLHSVTWPTFETYHPRSIGQSSGYYQVLESLA